MVRHYTLSSEDLALITLFEHQDFKTRGPPGTTKRSHSKDHSCSRILWEDPSCEGACWDRKVKIPYR